MVSIYPSGNPVAEEVCNLGADGEWGKEGDWETEEGGKGGGRRYFM